MSVENVEVVRRGLAAFARNDPDGVKASLHADVTWVPALGGLTTKSVYRGPEAICQLLFEEVPTVLEDFSAEILDLEATGDAVLTTARFSGRSKSTGLDVEQTFFHVYRVQDGKVIEMHGFTTRDEAVKDAGLSE